MNKMTSGKLGSNKKIFGASEMMDKTPANCISRLCTLTVSKMVLTKPINVELSSVYLVIKMAHSRRTIRSTEININSSSSPVINKELMSGENLECSPTKRQSTNLHDDNQLTYEQPNTSFANSQATNLEQSTSNTHTKNEQSAQTILNEQQNTLNHLSSNQPQSPTTPLKDLNNPLLYALSPEQQFQQHLETLQLHTIELDTKIVFTFQYPHFLKKGSNQLQIMIQRRKKYKNRAILGFKTLAIGQINLAEIFANSTNINSSNLTGANLSTNLTTSLTSNQQQATSNIVNTINISTTATTNQQLSQTSSNTIESTSAAAKDAIASQMANNSCTQSNLPTTTANEPQTTSTANLILLHPELKIDLKCSEMVKKTQTKPQHIIKSQLLMASIVVSSICLEPVTQEHRRQKSLDKAVSNQVVQESEDEEFFNWNDENSDTDAGEQSTSQQPHEQSNSAKQKLNKWRRQMNSGKARKLFASLDKNTSDEQQRNLNVKQRLINLIRKFTIPDSSNFDSQEQYEAALERELMVNVVDNVEDEQDIEDLLAASVNLDEQGLDDIDDLSDYSTQEFDDCLSISSTPKPSLRPFFSTCTLVDADDDLKNYVKKHIHEEENEELENQIPEESAIDATDTGLQPKNRKWNEKRSKLFTKTTNYIAMKDRKSLMAIIRLLAKHKNQNFLPKESDNNLKKSFLEQLDKVFPPTTDEQTITIPEQISFIQSNDLSFLTQLKNKLVELNHSVVETSTFLEMKTTFTYLITRIQKFCNCNSKAPNTIKICIFGSDAYINTVLRAYVDFLSNKSPEWQSYFRFYPIPLCNTGSITLSLFLGSVDPQYQTNFCNGKWKELFDSQNQLNLVQELISRVKNYLNNSTLTVQVPIAESMIMYKTVQAFIPFICSVKIGFQEKPLKTSGNVSIEEDKQDQQLTQPTSSPPNNSTTISNTATITNKTDLQNVVNNLNNLSFQANSSTANMAAGCNSNGANSNLIDSKEVFSQQQSQTTQQNSPPTSPGTNNINTLLTNQGTSTQTIGSGTQTVPFSPTTLQSNTSTFLLSNGSNLVSPESKFKESIKSDECLDLQIDYWTTSAKQLSAVEAESSSKKTDFNNKTTLKNSFRTLQISRLPCLSDNLTSPSLTLSYLTKEKKQKIMRLGKKKEKDRDPDIKFQMVEGVHRLVCSYKNSSLKVNVDGVDWTGVKFFQLTAQWQTHIKSFPVALFGTENCPFLSTNISKSNRI